MSAPSEEFLAYLSLLPELHRTSGIWDAKPEGLTFRILLVELPASKPVLGLLHIEGITTIF